ncbi:uncharacterized protein [Centruroides vittatus]|uniref:uncharacterized protein n=1 Tax=Centruroides vittatus TaxID=120091 RepID=UPI00350F5B9E
MKEKFPVIFYKLQGKDCSSCLLEKGDFMLMLMTPFQASSLQQFGNNILCLDSTHETTNYDFLLTTLLVVDAHGGGFSAAYLLSNRVDTAILMHFFNVICDKVGSTESKYVNRNWRKQFQKVKGTQKTKMQVYKCIRMLLEKRNEEEFQSLLDSVLNDLLTNDITRDFGNHFLCRYANRVYQWAYCYRRGLGINCNMYVESFHKILKHICLQGKKGKRLDRVIYALMRFTRDKLFDRLHKTIKGKLSSRLKQIGNNHIKSKNINKNSIV